MHDFLLIIQNTNAFFLGTSTDITSQITALHEETDWPYATSTAEVRELQSSETQPSETQPSETLPVVTRKQSKYWNYIGYTAQHVIENSLFLCSWKRSPWIPSVHVI